MRATLSGSRRSRFERDESRRPRRHAASVTYTLALALLLALVVGAAAVYAQAGGGYDLAWNTVDTGGVTFASADGYTLGGTPGQPDAALWSGGGYTLAGGFWHTASAGGGMAVYLPIIVKP
jgi:hypothetical protein